jgi:hypothetical protein
MSSFLKNAGYVAAYSDESDRRTSEDQLLKAESARAETGEIS